jgi:hypothetical protein
VIYLVSAKGFPGLLNRSREGSEIAPARSSNNIKPLKIYASSNLDTTNAENLRYKYSDEEFFSFVEDRCIK